jgi:hypothetical protein
MKGNYADYYHSHLLHNSPQIHNNYSNKPVSSTFSVLILLISFTEIFHLKFGYTTFYQFLLHTPLRLISFDLLTPLTAKITIYKTPHCAVFPSSLLHLNEINPVTVHLNTQATIKISRSQYIYPQFLHRTL